VAYCETEKRRQRKLRDAYQAIAGRIYSDRRWYEIKKEVLSRIEGNVFGDEFAIALLHHARAKKLKKMLDLTNENSQSVVEKALKIAISIPGITIEEYSFNLFSKLKVSPPRSTRYWFFKKIGGYQPSKEMNSEEKLVLTFVALNWKINKEGYKDVEFIKKELKAS
jgi:hypothetical protein